MWRSSNKAQMTSFVCRIFAQSAKSMRHYHRAVPKIAPLGDQVESQHVLTEIGSLYSADVLSSPWNSNQPGEPEGITSNTGSLRDESPIYERDPGPSKVPRPSADAIRKQYDLETKALTETVEKYRQVVQDVVKLKRGAALGPAQKLLAEWFLPLTQAIDAEQAAVTQLQHRADRTVYGPYLLLLKPDTLAAIAMHETLNCVLHGGGVARAAQVMGSIGDAVRAEIDMMKLKSHNRKMWQRLQGPMDGKKMQRLRLSARQALDDTDWPRNHTLKLGSVLLDLLINTAVVDVPKDHPTLNAGLNDETQQEDENPFKPSDASSQSSLPNHVRIAAFRHHSKTTPSRRVGEVQAHPFVRDMMHNSAVPAHQALAYPMLVPPKAWAPGRGGYLKQKVPLMRFRGSKMQREALKRAKMPQVYEGLNCLGRVPWKINPLVYNVVSKVWSEGGGVADIPSQQDVELPCEPDYSVAANEKELALMKRRYRLNLSKAKQTNQDLFSLRCDMMLKLKVAEMFAEEPAMYFPFNLDFRGRAYPVPPHLNHMGADVCRGLLMFAEAKPLGTNGLRWLKIHLSNLMGVDKVSFDQRVAFIEENLENVFDSANNPLNGNRWWLSADAPWQALAACSEIKNALESGCPEEYECALPVHQDGSCNGLQHYAALGRDEPGGRAVNLVAADKPQDVYSEVLRLVLKKIDEDAASVCPVNDVTIDPEKWKLDQNAAAFVKGFVDRKVVKQTVMTSVYGVTFVGAREQILARLREKFDPAINSVAASMHVDELDNALYNASKYLARTTLGSLGEMFQAADAIKDWLGTAAKLTALHNQPMAWVTPLGLPVMQPYRRQQALLVKTILQDVVIVNDSDQLPVSSQRQKSAFPPNYVHSLDSTHMLLTAIDCTRRGLTFSAVHDSYWTHACDVDTMNMSLREQFVRLYSLPLLEQFRDTLQVRFPAIEFPPLPDRGTLDISKVLASPYFFA